MPVQEGVSDRVLAEGFGHFKETVKPGRDRQLRARRTPGHARRAPLRDMPKLRPGDEIVVAETPKKATYTYNWTPTRTP